MVESINLISKISLEYNLFSHIEEEYYFDSLITLVYCFKSPFCFSFNLVSKLGA